MEQTPKGRLLLLALAAGLAACSSAAGADVAQAGTLTSGQQFGATVGQPTSVARQVLIAEGYGYEGVVACAGTTLRGCQQSDRFLAFQPVALGLKGHIYLKIENERVAEIAWQIYHVAYLDG
ncbi:MAG: hypothetical protein P4L57_06770 [Rhizomicrobium sp.]|nr:hypothetical protein [Rhizomicrobium sp.]